MIGGTAVFATVSSMEPVGHSCRGTPYPRREMFITNREMKMGYESVYKACYVCVDGGLKETAIVLPKAEIEAGLPPA